MDGYILCYEIKNGVWNEKYIDHKTYSEKILTVKERIKFYKS